MKKRNWLMPACAVLFLSACTEDEQAEEQPTSEESPAAEASESETAEEAVEDEEVIDQAEEEAAVEVSYRLNPQNSKLEPIDEADEQVVLMTIDDAPSTCALEMANVLKEYDVPAIFFVNGHFLSTQEEQEILAEIHEMGFAIGNHTNTHVNLKQSSEAVQEQEIVLLNETVEAIIGEAPRFFRAPFGVNTEYSNALVEELGMVRMNWTYGYDFMQGYMEKEALADIMVNAPELNNGGNLLMHDREWTKEALPDIIDGLRDKGFDFVDPDEIKGVHP
ncbi:polysaccharide deacetylase family protein [Planococcus dechangensis]|uniref:Polysaccharide deacetylase family protein n=1 Tax=Planococcus dechangensis TaxID=1176255 RepID=A0ABV9M9R3_9BACL